MRRTTATTAALAVLVAVGCASPDTRPTERAQERGAPAAPSATDGASPSASPEQDATEVEVVPLDSVPCAPNESCPLLFELDGRTYAVVDLCHPVAPEAVGDPVRIPGRGSPALPSAVHHLQAYPMSAGVAVDVEHCDDRTLALPVEYPDDRDRALLRARLRCDALTAPPPQDRCGRGGDAQWHVGDAWMDDALAPFRAAVTEADVAIEAGDSDWAWRTDPLEVASRRYREEPQVCSDSEGPCPWDVALVEEDDRRAVVEGIVKPFPRVTWDIRIVVERLGAHSWWTTRITVEPRPAESTPRDPRDTASDLEVVAPSQP